MAIDFTLSPAQRELQGNAREFAASVLSGVKASYAQLDSPEDCFFATKPFFDEVAAAGFIHALIPQQYGGTGFANIDLAIAAEELMAVDVSVPTTMLGVGLGLGNPPIINGHRK